MNPITIAHVRYLNTVPLVHGLDKVQGISLAPSPPAKIADEIRAKRASLGLASLIDVLPSLADQHPTPLALVPVGMIGCDGPTLTVRVFSRVPFGSIARLRADQESHTSVALCRIILDQMYKVRPTIESFDASSQGGAIEAGPNAPEAMLLIGDRVITSPPSPSAYTYQLDLGAAWHELTGLPFVYAMWMCRADDIGNPAVLHAASLLDRQRRHNLTRLDWIIQHRASSYGWPVKLAAEYLGRLLRYRVTDRAREAVGRFLTQAATLGIVSDSLPTWVELSGSSAWRDDEPVLVS